MNRIRSIVLAAAVGLCAVQADARQMREETVHFDEGQTTVELLDRIYGRESVTYRVYVRKDQTLQVRLDPSNPGTYFNVYEPDKGPGNIALGSSDRTGPTVPDINTFSTKVRESGIYSVSVYLVRAAAREGEESRFVLEVTAGDVQEEVASTSDAPASADGPFSGPEFYVVEVDSRLRIHAGPNAESDVVLHASDGTVFRNLGCLREADRTWCEVERPADGLTGWAASEYLRGESGAFTSMVGMEETPYGKTDGWNILVRRDTGNGCIAESTRDGVQIQVGFDPVDDSTFLAIFTEKHMGFENGEHLAVLFDLDGDEFVGDITEEKRPGFEGGYVHITNPDFLMDLSEKETLMVMPAGLAPFAVSLDGSKAAIGKMIECQLAQM